MADRQFNLGSDYIDVKTSNLVKLNENFNVITQDGPIYFDVEIIADFATIDKKYHEICLNVLTSKYLNKVSFGDNPFSECRPIKKRKWWQFWKPFYFTN